MSHIHTTDVLIFLFGLIFAGVLIILGAPGGGGE